MTKTQAGSINQISNKPLRERIADMLRESIMRAELMPGQAIVESELAATLGVSRAPLREALQILNSEGLVEIVPYHRTTVRKLTRRDIEELFSLRSTLEGFAVRRIIGRGDHDQLDALHEIYQDMLKAVEDGDPNHLSELDHRFHDMVVHLSKHNLLISNWHHVSQRVRQVLALRDIGRSNMRQLAESHRPLIEAVEAGDPDVATQAFDDHIRNASNLVIELWEEDEEYDNVPSK